MKIDTGLWGVFRKSTAVGVVSLLSVVSWAPTATAKVKSDWSKVLKIKDQAELNHLRERITIARRQGIRTRVAPVATGETTASGEASA